MSTAAHYHPNITPFDPTTVALVDSDSTSGNLLVCGNMPLYTASDGQVYFAYDQLSKAIQALSNLPQPFRPFQLSNFGLVDVNLIDNQGDLVDLTAELSAFAQNVHSPPFNTWPPYTSRSWTPTTIYGTSVQANKDDQYPGGLVYWPVQACPVNNPPYDIYVDTVPGYEFAKLVDFVNSLLTAKTKPPSVIYFHCDSGVNRTGALKVAYFFKYGSYFFKASMTLQEAFANADSIAPGKQAPSADDVQLVQAYCNYVLSGSPNASNPNCSAGPP